MKTLQEIEHDILELTRMFNDIKDDVYSLKINEATKPIDKPTFKGGDWVFIFESEEEVIKRIVDIDGHPFCPVDFDRNINGGGSWELDGMRHATKEEIETYLRKVCDEKGFKDGIKIKGLRFGMGGNMSWQTQPCMCAEYNGYNMEGDYLNVSDDTNDLWEIVYKQGKFAEIIEDKKKKPLPKTKEEMIDLFLTYGFCYVEEQTGKDLEEFLKDYED